MCEQNTSVLIASRPHNSWLTRFPCLSDETSFGVHEGGDSPLLPRGAPRLLRPCGSICTLDAACDDSTRAEHNEEALVDDEVSATCQAARAPSAGLFPVVRSLRRHIFWGRVPDGVDVNKCRRVE